MSKQLNPLTPDEKYVIQGKGTERPFMGEYTDTTAAGLYICRQCDAPLYRSEHKFPTMCVAKAPWPISPRWAPPKTLKQTK